MPGSIPSMAVQKKSAIPPSQGPLSTRTIKKQNKRNASERTGDTGTFIQPNTQKSKKTVCSLNKSPQKCNIVVHRALAVQNGQNVDERLRAARERREEHQKALASREQSRLEREQRARRYYEQQLQQRKKKLLEHRLKEERRRTAVEEKRRQRLREEKERVETAVRRTLEKSQKAQQNQSHNPRGRRPTKNVPRRLPLTPWEKNLVSRLLTPTCSYLARSKSAGVQSGEEVSFHSMNTTISSTTSPKPQQYSGSARQFKPSTSPSPSRSNNLEKINAAKKQDTNKNKKISYSPVDNKSPVHTSVKPANVTQSRTSSPSPDRSPRRSVRRHSTSLQLELPSVPEEDVAVSVSDLSPGNTRPVRMLNEVEQEKTWVQNPPFTIQTSCSNQPDKVTEAVRRTAGDGSPLRAAPQPPEVMSRPSGGTTDPEAASRLLAEKRREARLQREKEEQERLQREEADRRCREELERRRAEERARQQAEAQRLIEEKKRREEEEQRRAEEERAQAMKEAALLQKQREEEQAKERAKAEQLKQERELLAQKEEEARQARKKRLEEIMRRTRRTDSPDTKSATGTIHPNEAQPKENTQPVLNGTIEEAAKLPVVTKSSQLGLTNEEDMVPVVAFKERRSLRTLTGLEEIQSHQRAEVI